jgi:aquaporin Z
MRRHLTELVGTFFLVFAIGMATTSGTAAAPLAIGSMLTAMIYMGGHVSGAHFNPAVGVGPIMVDALSGEGGFGHVWLYLLGPLVGAAVAVPVFKLQTGAASDGAEGPPTR